MDHMLILLHQLLLGSIKPVNNKKTAHLVSQGRFFFAQKYMEHVDMV
jgi:hypothetical protein